MKCSSSVLNLSVDSMCYNEQTLQKYEYRTFWMQARRAAETAWKDRDEHHRKILTDCKDDERKSVEVEREITSQAAGNLTEKSHCCSAELESVTADCSMLSTSATSLIQYYHRRQSLYCFLKNYTAVIRFAHSQRMLTTTGNWTKFNISFIVHVIYSTACKVYKGINEIKTYRCCYQTF